MRIAMAGLSRPIRPRRGSSRSACRPSADGPYTSRVESEIRRFSGLKPVKRRVFLKFSQKNVRAGLSLGDPEQTVSNLPEYVFTAPDDAVAQIATLLAEAYR